MDILCTRCGEPYDVCSLADDMTPEEAADFKAGRGCPCCSRKKICDKLIPCHECPEVRIDYPYCNLRMVKPRADDARQIQAELASVMGDDIDGLAATMEDFGLI